MSKAFFLDTYAIIEMIKGNKNYEKYKTAGKITSMLNLLELYYALLKDYDEKTADFYFTIFLNFSITYSDKTIKNAAKFRLANKGKKLSYVDCLGYILALENEVQFLTGDKGFESMKYVEFVK